MGGGGGGAIYQKIPAQQKLLKTNVQGESWGQEIEQVLSTVLVLFLMLQTSCTSYCPPKQKKKNAQPKDEKKKNSCPRKLPNPLPPP